MQHFLSLLFLLSQITLFAQSEQVPTFDFDNADPLEYYVTEDEIIQKIEIDDARFYRSAYLRFGDDSIHLLGTLNIICQDSTSMELRRVDYFTPELIPYSRLKFFGDKVEYFANNEDPCFHRTSVDFVVSDTILTLTFRPPSKEPVVNSYVAVFYDGTKLLLSKAELPEDSRKESVILQISKNAMKKE